MLSMYYWINLLYARNYHNIVNQLYLKKNKKFNITGFMCVCVCVCVYVLSRIWHFVTPWTPPLGSSVYRISQARILKWVAISFSRWSSRVRDQTCVSYIGR